MTKAKHTPGWTTPEEEAAKTRAYEDALVSRLERGLPLTTSDKRDARRIKRQRAAFAKAGE